MTTVPAQQTQQPQIPAEATPGGLFQVSPPQFQFTASKVASGQVSKVKLKNLSSTPLGFKFKTNAPMKYSVKPVLGVVAPGETVKVFVRSDSWINPQDRFLLQTITLNEEERKALDPQSWKALDSKRLVESYIPCSSISALTIRDHEEDAGAISSSSATSSTASNAANTPPFHAYDTSRSSNQQRSPVHQHQVFERWQYSESTRPTISIGGLGRRRSSASSTCSSITSSPGTYPTLFTPTTKSFDQLPSPMSTAPTTPTTPTAFSAYSSKRNSLTSNFQGSIITSTIKEEPSGTGELIPSDSTHYLPSALGFTGKRILRTASKFKFFRHYSKKQALLLSLVCLIFGMLMPYDRVFNIIRSTATIGADNAGTLDLENPSRSNIYRTPDVIVNLNGPRIQSTRQPVAVEGAV
ncbi:hypothetical protein BGX27_009294 [Mortierella sp. AM989]|nr:hypothetical protein BGX27_009294 [Mortierella sp. AM989]